MPAPTVIPMTPDIIVSDSYTIRVTALDPSTGAVVSAVKVDGFAFLARNLVASAAPEPVSPSPVSGAYTSA